ncbi:hypothetical protein GWK47_020510 [Chionoecetes opilio]|uniref:Uncharacterized protein n=1 Tax=Chionoecetes opilio TaxID=41210 RepID=A0A8J4XP57_CHIOP|nr:hypothetical protein GWK47_020510 [Chionoecetes opilio]
MQSTILSLHNLSLLPWVTPRRHCHPFSVTEPAVKCFDRLQNSLKRRTTAFTTPPPLDPSTSLNLNHPSLLPHYHSQTPHQHTHHFTLRLHNTPITDVAILILRAKTKAQPQLSHGDDRSPECDSQVSEKTRNLYKFSRAFDRKNIRAFNDDPPRFDMPIRAFVKRPRSVTVKGKGKVTVKGARASQADASITSPGVTIPAKPSPIPRLNTTAAPCPRRPPVGFPLVSIEDYAEDSLISTIITPFGPAPSPITPEGDEDCLAVLNTSMVTASPGPAVACDFEKYVFASVPKAYGSFWLFCLIVGLQGVS